MAKVRNRKRRPQVAPEAVSTPVTPIGEKLRHARESQGLDIATVAEQLHLKKALVVALESEDFERLPARVFVRGYYRNYARLLGLPEQQLLKEFDERCPEGDNCSGAPPVVAQSVRKEIRSSHGLVRLVTWLVVISVFVAFALWWKDYSARKEAGETTLAETPAVQQQEPAGTARPPVPSGERVAEQQPQPVPEPAAADRATTAGPATEEPRAAPVVEEMPVAAVEPSRPEPAARPRVVQLHFSEDSWVDVRGADGSFKVVGTRKSGETLELGGRPPYHIILGNARGVRLLVDGKPYDLASRTRRNVARLTLDP